MTKPAHAGESGDLAAAKKSNFSRREFLEVSAAAAGGSVAARTVLLSPGTTDLPSTVARLPRADVVLAGEPREWEAVPYVLDAGPRKGIICTGRIVPLPSWRLVAHATGSNGSQGRLVRAAIALFLVALAEGSLLLRLSAQLPRRA